MSKKINAKLNKMRVDIRMGLSAVQLAKKYKISEASARAYRTHYLKAINAQKN